MADSANVADRAARRLDPRGVQAALVRLARAEKPPWLHAEVARRMAERLELILLKPSTIVDWWGGLGAGEALLEAAYPKAERIVVEPGEPWLQRSRERARRPWWTAGRWTGGAVHVQTPDEPFPTPPQLVWCNMALHLVSDPPALFDRWLGSLRADGFVMFSCLGPGTLRELRGLYARLGWPPPTPGFIDMHDLGDMLVQAGFADPVMDQETLDLRYESPKALLAELRTLGGNTAPDRLKGLRTPRWLRRLESELDALRGADGKIGLSVEVAYGHAFKAGPRMQPGAPTVVSLDDMRALVRQRHAGRPENGGR